MLTMGRLSLLLVAFLALTALSACAAEEKATPAPASPAAGARPTWEQEWDTVLAAAKKEGKVTVTAPAGSETTRALTEPFEKRFGIKVELIQGATNEVVARIKTERAAGQYLWDIYLGGHTDVFCCIAPDGMLDPLEPALILPEVKDPKNWMGGALDFIDKDKTALLTLSATSPILYINTNLVQPGEIKSWKDLLDTKWKGKIVTNDPRVGGPGRSAWVLLYATKELGPDFIRQLGGLNLPLIRGRGGAENDLAQGKYSICFGCGQSYITPLMDQGLPVAPVDPKQIKEGAAFLTGGAGVVALYNKAPHPNAAKVFINWFLTKEGQTEYARSRDLGSRRLDVSADWLKPFAIPDMRWWDSYSQEGNEMATKMDPVLKEVLRD